MTMTIYKVYPELRCETCGNVLETEEPETEHVFVLLVKPCQMCAAQPQPVAPAPDAAGKRGG